MSSRSYAPFITALVLCLLWTTVLLAADVPVPNGSFEQPLTENQISGWPSPFGSAEIGRNLTITTERASHGKQSLRLDDPSAAESVGLRSDFIPAVAGATYKATAQAFLQSGGAQLYLEFWNEAGQRIAYTSGGGGAQGSWGPITVQAEAPSEATKITLLLYSHIANTGIAFYDQVALERLGASTSSQGGVIRGVAPIVFDLSQATFEVPSLEQMRQNIPSEHPRLFVRPETLDELRKKHKTSPFTGLIWKNITTQALIASVNVMPAYPPDAKPGGVFDVVAWRAGITIASQIVNDLDALGFAYLISGQERYGEAGKKLLLHVASWDPNGTSSRTKNDEISMRLLYSLSRAYDWLYPVLSPEERKLVQETMRERGNDVYLAMRSRNFENTLLDNHLVRTMGFLGQAALAFMGEFPEAEVWFDYIASLYLVKYPQFGGDEGGWSQGVSYWQSYINWCLEFLDAFKIATDVDLYQKPFFRNTAYFKLYAHPPQSKVGAFGDHADVGPGDGAARVVQHFALAYQDPTLQWYASKITSMGRVPSIPMNSFMGYLLAPATPADMLDPVLPADFPQSRLFSDIGWTIMNVDMDDWENNVHVKFKSSPYGSFNHSHAEQNSFMIEAYGSPLAISSGYYPWYGSPHHATWTWESRSKNTILVNDKGQGVQNINAKGRILATSFSSQFDYVLGDATQAYQGRVDSFLRHLWFIKPNVIAVYDELEAKGPAAYDWLLHSPEKMEVNSPAGYVRVPGKTAEMWASFVAPGKLEFSLTDQFTVPPEDREAGKPNQWHLTAKAQSEDGTQRFLTVMVPRPITEAEEEPPLAEAVATVNGYGAKVTVSGKEIVVAFRDSSADSLQVAGYSSDATALALWQDSDGSGLIAIGATTISLNGKVIFASDSPTDQAWTFQDGELVAANAAN